MSERWLDSQTDDQNAARTDSFWAAMRGDMDAGAFWADRIKQYRDEPGKRMQMAMNNLPLPGAFREAAIALRAMIRTKRKTKEPYEDELGLLYWLAAIESFMLPYADKLKEPGYNVIEAIPGKRLRTLPIDYQQLGYEKLKLLNKTDVKWIIQASGEPQQHQTLNKIHRTLWDEYESKLILARQAKNEKFKRELQEMMNMGRVTAAKSKTKSGCAVLLFLGMTLVMGSTLGIAAFMEGL